tara:strand:- start:545 stop:814 length:270 start_codon:yes stop_codon:yes gene_type:complete
MEKIIFFSLVIPILGFVLYLGGSAIMNGFSAKNANKSDENIVDNLTQTQETLPDNDQLSSELTKLNELYKSGALNQEEFEKAKKKLLDS